MPRVIPTVRTIFTNNRLRVCSVRSTMDLTPVGSRGTNPLISLGIEETVERAETPSFSPTLQVSLGLGLEKGGGIGLGLGADV